jgi:hypothetical protein
MSASLANSCAMMDHEFARWHWPPVLGLVAHLADQRNECQSIQPCAHDECAGFHAASDCRDITLTPAGAVSVAGLPGTACKDHALDIVVGPK